MSAISDVAAKRFLLMGIVNATPDSFYGGGRHADAGAAVAHGLRLAAEGADIIDVGGASSRPGASAVPPEEEVRRVLPVIRRLAAETGCALSVDTTWSAVARAALDAGAAWINDTSAGRNDPAMADLAAGAGCTVVLMHSRGTPQTMQGLTGYADLAAEVLGEILAAVQRFVTAGVKRERIVIDPGIGFAKTADQSVALLRRLDLFVKSGYPVLVGTSRKSFVGHLTGRNAPERLYGTLGSVASAFMRGARIFRVHDVGATGDFLKVLSEIEHGTEEGKPCRPEHARDDLR
jgi:dihydropteroate synthase